MLQQDHVTSSRVTETFHILIDLKRMVYYISWIVEPFIPPRLWPNDFEYGWSNKIIDKISISLMKINGNCCDKNAMVDILSVLIFQFTYSMLSKWYDTKQTLGWLQNIHVYPYVCYRMTRDIISWDNTLSAQLSSISAGCGCSHQLFAHTLLPPRYCQKGAGWGISMWSAHYSR